MSYLPQMLQKNRSFIGDPTWGYDRISKYVHSDLALQMIWNLQIENIKSKVKNHFNL